MRAFLEILDIEEFFEPTSSDSDFEYPEVFRCSRCKVCGQQVILRDPEYVIDKTICWCCCCEIRSALMQFYANLHKRRIIYKNRLKLHDEIRDFGMRPDRIFQTQLFENYFFADLIHFALV